MCEKPPRPCVYTDCHHMYLPAASVCTLTPDSATGCANMLQFCGKQFVRRICASSCLCATPESVPRTQVPSRDGVRSATYYTMPFAQHQKSSYRVEEDAAADNWEGFDAQTTP